MPSKSKEVVERRYLRPLPELIRARLKNSISFYFSNLPEDTKYGHLWKVFGKYGKVKDVFLPLKKNKEGKRFGFVRFADNGNEEELIAKLRQVRVQSTNLYVNISKFHREDVVEARVEVLGPATVHPVVTEVPSSKVVAGVTFASVSGVAGQSGIVKEVAEVVCESRPGRIEELSESVVGLLLPNISVQRIREQLIVAGMENISVISLGGNQALVSSPIKGLIKESLLVRKDWWISWFVGFTKWSRDVPHPGRCVWLTLKGAPAHLWCPDVFGKVGAIFGDVQEVLFDSMCFESAKIKVLVSGLIPIAAAVVLVSEGRRYPLFVSEDIQMEEHHRFVSPARVTAASGPAGLLAEGLEGYSEEEAWAEEVGNNSLNFEDSDTWQGEDGVSVKSCLGERDSALVKKPLLEKTSTPTNFCLQNPLSSPSFLVKSVCGEEEDSDRRRKVSLNKENVGSACSKGNFQNSKAISPASPHSACNLYGEKEGQLLNEGTTQGGHCGLLDVSPSTPTKGACGMVCENELVQISKVGSVTKINMLEGANSAGVGPHLTSTLTSCGTRVPRYLQNSNFVLGSKNDVLGLGDILYTNQEHGNHVDNQQLANTPITSGTNDVVSSFIRGTTKQAEEILDMRDVKEEQAMVPVQSTFSDTVMRQHIVLSSVSSPDTRKVSQPVFFSRDAKEKRKPGRPKKKPRGRPKGKGTLTLVDASDVMRELFKDAELRNRLRKSTDRCEVVIPIPDPGGASGLGVCSDGS